MIMLFFSIDRSIAQTLHFKIPPTAVNDSVLIGKNQTIDIDVLKNDTDPDGNINLSTIQITSTAQLGLVNVLNKKIQYTPGTNVCGFDSIKYRLTDNNSEQSNIATVYIEITCFNIAPIAKDDQFSLDEDKLDSIDIFDNDKYTDGPGIEFNIVTSAKHGTASVSTEGMFKYISDKNYQGLDTTYYSFCDLDPSGSLCDTAMVSITVNPINDPPIAVNDSFKIYINKNISANISLNDTSIDGPSLNYSLITQASKGTLSLNNQGQINYQASTIIGLDSAKVEVCDLASISLCDTSWIYFTILPVFDKPIARNDTLRVPMNSSKSMNILKNDILPNSINTSNVFFNQIPNTGTFNFTDSILSYTPTSNFTGIFTVKYYIKDNIDSISNTGTILIIINELPSSNDICLLKTVINQSLLINPFQNAIRGTAALNFNNIIISDIPKNGTLESYNKISRSIKYIPNENYVGLDSIKIRLIDNDNFESEEIKICIEVLNEIPVKTNGTISPNGDGINEHLSFDFIDDYPDNEVIIFDRYWNEVFRTKNYSSINFWDAANVATGTYYYIVNISVSESKKTLKGFITVLK